MKYKSIYCTPTKRNQNKRHPTTDPLKLNTDKLKKSFVDKFRCSKSLVYYDVSTARHSCSDPPFFCFDGVLIKSIEKHLVKISRDFLCDEVFQTKNVCMRGLCLIAWMSGLNKTYANTFCDMNHRCRRHHCPYWWNLRYIFEYVTSSSFQAFPLAFHVDRLTSFSPDFRPSND